LGRALEQREITRQMLCDVLADLDLSSVLHDELVYPGQEGARDAPPDQHLGVEQPSDLPLGVEIP